MHRSRYQPEAAPDHSHCLHAGNVGDVWAHAAVVCVLGRVAAGGRGVTYVETHAGEGASLPRAFEPLGPPFESGGRALGTGILGGQEIAGATVPGLDPHPSRRDDAMFGMFPFAGTGLAAKPNGSSTKRRAPPHWEPAAALREAVRGAGDGSAGRLFTS